MGVNMGLSIENSEKLVEEEICQRSIYDAIDRMKNFVFEAGAGSGKTYSLKQSIMHVLESNSRTLSSRNQKILCITYTNAAARELNSRIGNTDLVITSTIHDAMWDLIRNQQRALHKVHRHKITQEIIAKENEFKSKEDGKYYAWFVSQKVLKVRNKFLSYILDKDFVDRYYENKRSRNIKSFKGEIDALGYTFHRNQKKFEETFEYALKISKLIKAKNKLDTDANIKIKYDSMNNRDALHRMRFSHDTLLDYTLAISNSYPVMLDIIMDKYPYIFIDEFQDTSPSIIQLLNKASLRSKNRNRDICIGYFGDTVQGIYEKGIGNKLNIYHKDLVKIKKTHNRRSFKEVISVFDKLRNDELSQVSIYDDCTGGSFDYYTSKLNADTKTSNLIHSFLAEVKGKLSLTSDDKLCCLVLKNETIAELSGFEELYRRLGSLFKFNERAMLIINKDINKLDSFVRQLYNALALLSQKDIRSCPLTRLVPRNYKNITLKSASEHIKELRSIKCDSSSKLSDTLNDLFANQPLYTDILKYKLDETFSICKGSYSLDSFIEKSALELSASTFKEIDTVTDIINSVLDIKVEEFINWYNYVNSSVDQNDIFTTCHNSKGLEYDNVVIFLQDNFHNKTDYMSAFFDDPNNEDYISRRNLLYVSLSRAIRNLVVCFLYQDQEPSKSSVDFLGEAKTWCS